MSSRGSSALSSAMLEALPGGAVQRRAVPPQSQASMKSAGRGRRAGPAPVCVRADGGKGAIHRPLPPRRATAPAAGRGISRGGIARGQPRGGREGGRESGRPPPRGSLLPPLAGPSAPPASPPPGPGGGGAGSGAGALTPVRPAHLARAARPRPPGASLSRSHGARPRQGSAIRAGPSFPPAPALRRARRPRGPSAGGRRSRPIPPSSGSGPPPDPVLPVVSPSRF